MSLPALNPQPVIVVGGGISGLACAYRLQQAGIPVVLLEAENHVGGLISTKELDGFRFDLGPQSFLSNESLLALIEALGLNDELLRADSRAPRYILLGGQLVAAPLAPPTLLTTPLLGVRTKWKLFSEILRHTRPPTGDESIASFVRRKFSGELLDRLVAPFVSGVYAGDPEKLSLRAAFPKLHEFELKYGSVLRGAMKSRPAKGAPKPGLCSFRDGMAALPRSIAARLGDAVRTEATVTGMRAIKINGASCFELDVVRGDRRETLLANAVILAVPTNAAARILNGVSEKFAAPFARIEYAPLAVVLAGYATGQITNAGNGFGFLVPRSEGLRTLGTVWNSSLFAGRAPAGTSSFTSFAGGATDRALCELGDEEIAKVICGEVENILGVNEKPVARMVHRYARAIPQYNQGHTETIASLTTAASAVPGLFLAGNYLAGPAIGTCVELADRTANAARIYLASIGVAGVGAVAHA